MTFNKRMWAYLVGHTVLLASTITIYYTFYTAYTTPSYTTVVDINSVGEAHIEVIILIATMPFVFWSFWQSYKMGLDRYVEGEMK